MRGPGPPTDSTPAGGPLAALAPCPVAGCKGATHLLLCRLPGGTSLEREALRGLAGIHRKLDPLFLDVSSEGPARAVLILMISGGIIVALVLGFIFCVVCGGHKCGSTRAGIGIRPSTDSLFAR